ncbi:MAG TPA: glycosyltransferase [Ktedonobacteraceae bacterium]|nr:glycosyltransferase [Ktedonobacteraceae bacterium]
MIKPVISIIIITRNRPFLLGHCLERVWSQSSVGTSHDELGSYSASGSGVVARNIEAFPAEQLSEARRDSGVVARNIEIIVVDSSSNNESERVVARYPSTKYIKVRRERNNMPQARNRGLACATGEIIAFIDDDSMVQPGWLESLVEVYKDETIGAAGGRVIAMPEPYCDERQGPPRLYVTWLGRVVASNAGLVSKARVEVDHLIGCNMSFRRAALTEVGGFDPNFTMTNLREETDLCLRVKRAGWRIVFEPRIAVVHFSVRSLQPYFLERPTIQFSNGRNGSYFAIKHFGLTPRSIGGQLIDAGRSCGRAAYFVGLFSIGALAHVAGRIVGVTEGIRWLKSCEHQAHENEYENPTRQGKREAPAPLPAHPLAPTISV